MIKNILFDLDGTLLDFHKTERTAFFMTMRFFDFSPSEEIYNRYSEINKALWKDLEKKAVTRSELKILRFSRLFDEFDIKISPEAVSEKYEDSLSKGYVFMEGAEELLVSLYENYRLYLVTNGTKKVQNGRLSGSGITKYFKGIYISEDVGCEKPDIRFFEKVFSGIPDFHKEETVIVGDSLTSDMKGGKNAEITTVWLNTDNTPMPFFDAPDYVINKISNLPSLLKNLS